MRLAKVLTLQAMYCTVVALKATPILLNFSLWPRVKCLSRAWLVQSTLSRILPQLVYVCHLRRDLVYCCSANNSKKNE